MANDLPPSFFLYIRSRHSSTDAFSGFILCDAAKATENGVTAWKITPRAPYAATQIYTVECPKDMHLGEIYSGQYTVRTEGGVLLTKRISRTTVWNPANNSQFLTVSCGTVTFPVLEMAKHTTIFGAHKLKRNVSLQWKAPPPPGTPIQVVPPTPSFAQPGANVIQHVAPPTPKRSRASKPSGIGTLSLFVAKQLLEFAQTKHEMCPITAEEFITGETAVMPCGHLFMRMAIEETFKKEPNKCPACRQLGDPTYC